MNKKDVRGKLSQFLNDLAGTFHYEESSIAEAVDLEGCALDEYMEEIAAQCDWTADRIRNLIKDISND